MIEFKTYLGVAQTLRNKIKSAVDPKWLDSIRSPTLAFTHLSPKQMLDHLQSNGVELDDTDVAELIKQLYTPWDLNKNPATKFAWDDKIEKQLLKKNITAQPLVRLALAKAAFQATGEYEVALKAFKLKLIADQMFANFRTFIVAEYSKHFKNDRTKAKSMGFGIANQAITAQQQLSEEEARKAEMALALNKIVQNVQAASDKKMEALMDFTKDMLKQLVAANKPTNTGGNSTTNTNSKSRARRCTHCKCFHPKIPDDKCWNLEKNVASRPEGYVVRASGHSNNE